jgi:hypothetical protein
MQRTALLSGAALALLALAACSSDTTGATADGLSASEAQELASSMATNTGDALSDAFGSPGFDRVAGETVNRDVTVTETFTRTRNCPKGGTLTVAGTRTGTVNAATKTGTWNETGTRTDAACAHEVRSGDVVTVTGAPNVAIASSHSRTAGVPGTWTHTEKGAFDWARSDGKTGHCTVDITSTFDPAAHTYHTSGTLCNRTFDKTVTHNG